MVTIEFHDPSGAVAVTQPHAPRLASLERKRIGFLSNEQWQAYRTLPLLKHLLEHCHVDVRTENRCDAQRASFACAKPVDLHGDDTLDRSGQRRHRAAVSGRPEQLLEEQRISARPCCEQ